MLSAVQSRHVMTQYSANKQTWVVTNQELLLPNNLKPNLSIIYWFQISIVSPLLLIIGKKRTNPYVSVREWACQNACVWRYRSENGLEWNKADPWKKKRKKKTDWRRDRGERRQSGEDLCVGPVCWLWAWSFCGPLLCNIHRSSGSHVSACGCIVHTCTHAKSYTHVNTVQTRCMNAHKDPLSYRHPLTVQLAFCFVIGRLTSAATFVPFQTSFPLSLLIIPTVHLTLNADISATNCQWEDLNCRGIELKVWKQGAPCRRGPRLAGNNATTDCWRQEKNMVSERCEGGEETFNNRGKVRGERERCRWESAMRLCMKVHPHVAWGIWQ